MSLVSSSFTHCLRFCDELDVKRCPKDLTTSVSSILENYRVTLADRQ